MFYKNNLIYDIRSKKILIYSKEQRIMQYIYKTEYIFI